MSSSTAPAHLRRPAFSLIELVIVVVIIGIVAAIAVPRMSSAVSNSSDAAMAANLAVLDKAAEMYAAEHGQMTIAINADGSTSLDGSAAAARLLALTSSSGATGAGAIFGPYLRSLPTNPVNGLSTIRIGSLASPANTAGWIFDPTGNNFASDGVPAVTSGSNGHPKSTGASTVESASGAASLTP